MTRLSEERVAVYCTRTDAEQLDRWGDDWGVGRSGMLRMILRAAVRHGHPFAWLRQAGPSATESK